MEPTVLPASAGPGPRTVSRLRALTAGALGTALVLATSGLTAESQTEPASAPVSLSELRERARDILAGVQGTRGPAHGGPPSDRTTPPRPEGGGRGGGLDPGEPPAGNDHRPAGGPPARRLPRSARSSSRRNSSSSVPSTSRVRKSGAIRCWSANSPAPRSQTRRGDFAERALTPQPAARLPAGGRPGRRDPGRSAGRSAVHPRHPGPPAIGSGSGPCGSTPATPPPPSPTAATGA